MEQNFDLKTTEGRIGILKDLSGRCKQALKDKGVKLSNLALIQVNSNIVEISVKDTDPKSHYYEGSAFGSGITIYCDELNQLRQSPNTISFGACGAFDPLENPIQFIKALHVASLLENWTEVSKIVTEYCKEYLQIMKLIDEANGRV